VKGGGAWTHTNYNLLGDSFALALSNGSTSATTWGWTAGLGIEYALTDHWTTFAEYDHFDIPAAIVPFPTVAIISANNIAIKQTVDLFKMGVNFRFDLGQWPPRI
jgi:opacity protein-like surface antigen